MFKISSSDRVRSPSTLTIPSKESCPKLPLVMVCWEWESTLYQDSPCSQKTLSAELSLLTKPKRRLKALFHSLPSPPTLLEVPIQLLKKQKTKNHHVAQLHCADTKVDGIGCNFEG